MFKNRQNTPTWKAQLRLAGFSCNDNTFWIRFRSGSLQNINLIIMILVAMLWDRSSSRLENSQAVTKLLLDQWKKLDFDDVLSVSSPQTEGSLQLWGAGAEALMKGNFDGPSQKWQKSQIKTEETETSCLHVADLLKLTSDSPHGPTATSLWRRSAFPVSTGSEVNRFRALNF